MNLAFYGTLRDPEILTLIAGEAIRQRFHTVRSVKGWQCLHIEGEAYPLLRREATAHTEFSLYHNCTLEEWQCLAAYEGEEYSWTHIVIDGLEYRVFVAKEHIQASDDSWTLQAFQAHLKQSYLTELADSLRSFS